MRISSMPSEVLPQDPVEQKGKTDVNPPVGVGKSREIFTKEVLCQMIDELCYVKEAFTGGRHDGAGANGCGVC